MVPGFNVYQYLQLVRWIYLTKRVVGGCKKVNMKREDERVTKQLNLILKFLWIISYSYNCADMNVILFTSAGKLSTKFPT